MYIFKDISKEQLDNFNYSSPKGHLFQSSSWAEVKNNWTHKYIGGFNKDTNELILSSLILIRKLPLIPRYLAYIPRGFICDYNNRTLLSEFFNYLKNFMKKNKISFISLDPDINYNINDSLDPKGTNLLKFLTANGLWVNPSTNFDSIQPGTVFRLNIPNGSKNMVKEDLFNKFSSSTKRNIKTAVSRGLEIENYDISNITQDILSSFYELMKITGLRDNFIIRERSYFNILINKLNPNISMYLVKYNYDKDYSYLSDKLSKLRIKRDDLVSKLNSTKNNKLKNSILDLDRQIIQLKNKVSSIYKYRGKNIYLSGSIYVHHGNKAWYLYGASHNILRDTMPNYLMQWEMIKHSIDLGCKIYDFRGAPKPTKSYTSGLFKFKKGFNGDFIEFIGEIYVIRNRFIYFIYKKAFPKFKTTRIKLRNLLNILQLRYK